MFMVDLIPKFRSFAERTILSGHYDYLVPIESKGMLLVQKILENKPVKKTPCVRNARSFDFVSPDELNGKRVAIIDDTVFTGKTICKVSRELLKAGARNIDKYAFLLYDSKPYSSSRSIEDIDFLDFVSEDNYRHLADDLSQLSLQTRPSYPDHISFRIIFKDPVPPSRILGLCHQRGTVVEYLRDPNRFSWSVHWPDWTPDFPSYSTDSGLDKLRVTASPGGDYINISPIVFPVFQEQADTEADALQSNLLEIFTKSGQRDEAKARNKYESFTLSLRLRQAANFLADLKGCGIPIGQVQLLKTSLVCYFGQDIVEDIEYLCSEVLQQNIARLRNQHTDDFDEDYIHPLNRTAAAADVLAFLRQEYIKQNSSKENLYEYESVGRSINEISTSVGWPRGLISIVAEELNNYGYLTPLPFDRRDNGDKKILRSYRVTETATAWLYEV